MLFGNFVVACGVLVLPGMLDHLARDLQVPVSVAGQLLSLASVAMCIGAPLAAALTSQIDRRWLLSASLLALAIGHLACALAPGYGALAVLRPLSVVGAAIFTPQAAATLGLLVPPAHRAAAVTTAFLGWSAASVAGMPLGNLIADTLGWRAGFGAIALLAVVALVVVWKVVPPGLKVAPLSLASWRAVGGNARLRRILGSTLLWCAGHFMLLGYITPALRERIGAGAGTQALLLAGMGLSGLAGSMLLARVVGRTGPDVAARLALMGVCSGLLLWALTGLLPASTALTAVVMVVWGLGAFAFVSAQQARLSVTSMELASASIALNSSSLYAGQAMGAAAGGLLLAAFGFQVLAPGGLLLVLAALLLCVQADRGTR